MMLLIACHCCLLLLLLLLLLILLVSHIRQICDSLAFGQVLAIAIAGLVAATAIARLPCCCFCCCC